PKNWPDLRKRYGYGGFVKLEHSRPRCARMMIDGKLFPAIEDNCWSPRRRISDCNPHGVAAPGLSTLPAMFSCWAKPKDPLDLPRLFNDHVAEVVAKYPTRFAGLGTVPLQEPDLAIREMERCVRELGLCGVEIGSHVGEWNLDEPALFPFFA